MSLTDDLAGLAELHERGALTDEEYSRAKARLLQSRTLVPGDVVAAPASPTPARTARSIQHGEPLRPSSGAPLFFVMAAGVFLLLVAFIVIAQGNPSAGQGFTVLSLVTVLLGSGLAVAADARSLNYGMDQKAKNWAARNSPGVWAASVLFLWLPMVPLYLAKRPKQSSTARWFLNGALALTLIYGAGVALLEVVAPAMASEGVGKVQPTGEPSAPQAVVPTPTSQPATESMSPEQRLAAFVMNCSSRLHAEPKMERFFRKMERRLQAAEGRHPGWDLIVDVCYAMGRSGAEDSEQLGAVAMRYIAERFKKAGHTPP